MQNHWRAGSIAWQEHGADGTKYAVLNGSRNEPGAVFSYAFFIPAGFWDPAHWHTRTAQIFVASGVLHLGYGAAFDRAGLQPHPSGSFVIVPGEARHFDGGNEDTVIFGVAQGPWATHYVDPTHRSSAGTPA